MERDKKRKIVFLTIVFLVLLANIWFFEIPISNYFLTIMGMVGTAYLTYNYGLVWAFLFTALVFLGIFLQGKTEMGLAILFKVGGSGVVLGELVKRGKKVKPILFFSLLPGLLILLFFFLNYSEIASALRKELNQIADQLALTLSQIPGSDSTQLKDEISLYGEAVIKMLPAFQLISLLLDVFLAYLILQLLGAKLNFKIEKIKPFHLWRFWEGLTLILGAGLLLNIIGGKSLVFIGLNLIVISSFWFIIQGLATIEFFFKKANLKLFFKIVFYLFLGLTGILSLFFLVLFGFLDSWFDFRKIKGALV